MWITKKTGYGKFIRTLLNEMKHISFSNDISELFEQEDDIAMMIIDMGYKIEKREYSIIKNTHSYSWKDELKIKYKLTFNIT